MEKEITDGYATALMRFNKAIKHLKHPEHLSFSEMMVIGSIFEITKNDPETKEVKMSDISKKLALSKPAVTQSISKLVETGFLKREVSDTDRRVINVSFTDEGACFFKESKDELLNKLDYVFSILGKEKSEQFFMLLNELTEILTEYREKGNDQ